MQSPAPLWKYPLTWLVATVALLLALGWLAQTLAPILAPFLLAAMLSYIGSPLVDTLEKRRVPRALGAVIAIGSVFAAAIALVVLLVPLVSAELAQLAARLPVWVQTFNERLAPKVSALTGVPVHWDILSLQAVISAQGTSLTELLQNLWSVLAPRVSVGTAAVISLVGTLLVAPAVMFYLLRDWHSLLARLTHIVPVPWQTRACAMARRVDQVLAEFLRGQLALMLSLACFYAVTLWAVGMDYALPVGIVTGLLVFVPYVGFGVGLALALVVSVQQGWPVWGWVLAVFMLGQVLESFVLTPRLVGERIGLNPVAVIFALMAFGQVFGFVGVLLALPLSAVLLVGLREAHAVYVKSDFYRGRESV